MLRHRLSLGTVAWIVIGTIVAAQDGFFDRFNSVDGVGSAILAVLLWPLVLLNVHIGI